MQVLVKMLSGRTIVLECDYGDTVQSVKQQIHSKAGIPPHHQRLVLNSQLQDDRTLGEHNFEEEDIIHLVLSICMD
jgi:hypothetical protein